MSETKLIPIRKAAKHFPVDVSYPSVCRWAKSGVRGHILGSVVIAGRRYTTIDMIKRFIANGVPEEETAGV
jgi:hypothetical protein